MAITTSPDNIPSPTSGDPYNYVVDMAAIADGTQDALTQKANMGVGTSTQRTAALSKFPDGALWYDTTTSSDWRKVGGAWVDQNNVWTSWTPTLTGTGWAAGNTDAYGKYKIIDGVAHVWGRITFGTTATFGSGSPTIPLPFAAAPRSNPINMWLFVGGVGTYILIGRAISNDIYGLQNGAAGRISPWTSTSPATLASGNYLDFTATIVVA